MTGNLIRQDVTRRFLLLLIWLLLPVAVTPGWAMVKPDATIRTAFKELFTETEPDEIGEIPYRDEFRAAARRYDLPLAFVAAVARGESFFDPAALSAKGAIGIMQLMPETAADYGLAGNDLLDPKKNIEVGTHLLADLYKRTGDPYLTLAAYYCGCGGIDEEQLTLRSDCNDYVHYIHSHLKKIIATGKTPASGVTKAETTFVLTHFNNFLDADNFAQIIEKSLSEIETEIFRKSRTENSSRGYTFFYELIIISPKKEAATRREIGSVTGFDFK